MDKVKTLHRVRRALRPIVLLSLIMAIAGCWRISPARAADYIAAAVADPARPAEQVLWDAGRKPAEALRFAAVHPGDRVGDFMSGGGYFTRLLSRVVGNEGRVYAFVPTEQLRNCAPEETAGTLALGKDNKYTNVIVLTGPVNRFHAPEPLDVVWTSLNFHDLYDGFMGPADVPRVTQSIFDALKPGGLFLVIDHVAEAGSGTRDTDSLHRVDPQVIIDRARAAGFLLEAQSNLLRNPGDDHTLKVFDPKIRGRTDQVVLKFRKPRRAASVSSARPMVPGRGTLASWVEGHWGA
jgi:predicted methyltransferase